MDAWTDTPTLHGDLVRLVALERGHADGVLAAADDDAVFAHLGFARPTTPAEALAVVDRYLSMRPAAVAWAQLDAGGDVAGITTFYDIDPDLRTVAIGSTWLSRRHWGTGLNTEAKLLLLRRAFDELGCVRVVWHTDVRNERSQAAIAGLGARREGVLRKHKLRRDGTWRDTVIFSMTDDEWPVAQEGLCNRL